MLNGLRARFHLSTYGNLVIWIKTKLLEKTAQKAEAISEAKWLDSLQKTVGPRIQAQLAYRNEKKYVAVNSDRSVGMCTSSQ
jgi:hypothetical protein